MHNLFFNILLNLSLKYNSCFFFFKESKRINQFRGNNKDKWENKEPTTRVDQSPADQRQTSTQPWPLWKTKDRVGHRTAEVDQTDEQKDVQMDKTWDRKDLKETWKDSCLFACSRADRTEEGKWHGWWSFMLFSDPLRLNCLCANEENAAGDHQQEAACITLLLLLLLVLPPAVFLSIIPSV